MVNDFALSTDVERTKRDDRVFRWCATFAFALACAWSLAFNLVDPDLWGHVRYGQDWISTGELPRTATHTFTAVEYPWINHENLAELALASCYDTFGVTGMLIAKCLLGMAIVVSMVWLATKHGVHPFVSWTLMLIVTTNLQPFFPLRPQLLSFVCCAACLVILDRGFRNWHATRQLDGKWLWWLPVVFIVWVNSHGGFVAGLAIMGAYLGGRIIEVRNNSRQVGLLALVGVACLAATLLNPYGPELHRWLAVSLIEARPEITEWLAPHPGDPAFWPWVTMLVIIAASLWGTTKRRDWVEIVILLLVIWQSALHLRHIAFVALLCGYWIPVHFESTLRRLLPNDRSAPAFSPNTRLFATVVLLSVIALQSLALDTRLNSFPVDRGRFPVDAIQFMADRNLSGKLVASFNWSQYALAALAPQVTVGFDGRYDTCYPLEVVDMHFDFLLGEAGGLRNRSPHSGPIDSRKVLNFEQPDLVLIDRNYETPLSVMQAEATKAHRTWVLLYRDRVAELWGRASKYAEPASPEFMPSELRVQDASPREGEIPWPALPLKDRELAAETNPEPLPGAQL